MSEAFRSGFVAIVGRTNVGKSTLMNRLIGMKIAITSGKPQTTRRRLQTVFTNEKGQIVFVDTPGIHLPHNRLSEYMDNTAYKSVSEVDLILFVVEPETYIGKGEQRMIERIKRAGRPVILAVNKSDTTDGEHIEAAIRTYREALEICEAVPVSALKGINTDALIDTIISRLPEGPMLYDEDTVTDETERDIVAEIIREKTLRNLKEEVPHGIAVSVLTFRERDNGLIDIEADVICEKDSHKGIVIGKGGSMLKKIGTESRKDIEQLLESRVNLKLFVKVRQDWRQDPMMLKSLGYTDKDKGRK
ncbi:MAG: GTPase Era [Lachnospiraceae bacterium]|nr:GTPase Era [Lachnospiraceae bacterium]